MAFLKSLNDVIVLILSGSEFHSQLLHSQRVSACRETENFVLVNFKIYFISRKLIGRS